MTVRSPPPPEIPIEPGPKKSGTASEARPVSAETTPGPVRQWLDSPLGIAIACIIMGIAAAYLVQTWVGRRAGSPAGSPTIQPGVSWTAPGPGADFPWPPPAPSAFYKIPRDLFGSAGNFGQVADRIELALGQAGYTENKFYSIKNDGFAIVTRIESIWPDGTCRENRERWLVNSPPMFSLRDLFEALLRARRGRYRVWAFAVTSASDTGFAAPPTENEIKQLFSRGGTSLPAEVRNLPFSRYHECLALVYEFERGDVPPPVLTVPSGLTGAQHLAAATILRGLER